LIDFNLFQLLLQYGTAPALVLIIYLLVWWKRDVSERIAKLEDRFEKFEHETRTLYAEKEFVAQLFSECVMSLKKLEQKVDKLIEDVSFLRGKDEGRKGK
jgi:hypothetical protein